MKQKLLILTCCVLGVLSLGAKKQGVIKIGCVGPITGDQASLGLDQLHALQIAVDEANGRGEIISGYQLEIISLDDQHNPSQAVAMAKRLASDPQVVAVVGHVNSSCSLAAAPIYQNARLTQISPSSSNPEISRKGYDTFFRTCATDDIQAPQAAYFAFTRLEARKVFIIDDKTTYGKGIADEFEQEILRLGAGVLGHEGIMQADKDFSPLLTKIKALAPDLIFFGGMYPEGALLVRQAKALGLSVKWMGGDGLYVKAFIDLAKEDAEGVYCTFIGADVRGMPSAARYIDLGFIGYHLRDAGDTRLIDIVKQKEPRAYRLPRFHDSLKNLYQQQAKNGTDIQLLIDQQAPTIILPPGTSDQIKQYEPIMEKLLNVHGYELTRYTHNDNNTEYIIGLEKADVAT